MNEYLVRFLHLFPYVRELEWRAFYDELTGVLRRGRFFELLTAALHTAEQNRGTIVLFYVDLDQFSMVNNTYGHAVGDRFLKFFARYLLAFLSEKRGVTVGRMGGDEFAAFFTADEAVVPSRLAEMTEDNLEYVDFPVNADVSIPLRASVGYSTTDEAGFSPDDLLLEADQKMFCGKM